MDNIDDDLKTKEILLNDIKKLNDIGGSVMAPRSLLNLAGSGPGAESMQFADICVSVEESENLHKEVLRLVKQDPMAALITLPKDNVMIDEIPRTKVSMPKEICDPSSESYKALPQHIKSFVQYLSANNITANSHKYISYHGYPTAGKLQEKWSGLSIPEFISDSTSSNSQNQLDNNTNDEDLFEGNQQNSLSGSGASSDQTKRISMIQELAQDKYEKLSLDDAEKIDMNYLTFMNSEADYKPDGTPKTTATSQLFPLFSDGDLGVLSNLPTPAVWDLKGPSTTASSSENLNSKYFQISFDNFKVKNCIEPLFLSFAVYDFATASTANSNGTATIKGSNSLASANITKISETFYFNFNDTTNTQNLLKNQVKVDESTKCKKAIFSISQNYEDLYLVFKVEKVLEGELPDIQDRKSTKQIQASDFVADFCSRLGKYRQPVAWMAFPLMSAADKEVSYKSLQKFDAGNFVKYDSGKCSDEDIYLAVQNMKRVNATKKMKFLMADFSFQLQEISPMTRSIPNCLDSCLNIASDAFQNPNCKILDEFTNHPVQSPYQQFKHNLYVYPLQLNLSKINSTARNVTCKIQLLSSSDMSDPNSICKAIYGKSSTAELSDEGFTSVLYHDRAPNYSDEIKVKLPVELTEEYHLFFTFYHITCSKKKNATEHPEGEGPIGFATLPLTAAMIPNTQAIINDGIIDLPVSLNIVPDYLSADAQLRMKFADTKRPLFKVKVKFESTLHTNDQAMSNFFTNAFQSIPTVDSIKNLYNCRTESLTAHFPVIIDRLLEIICSFNKTQNDLAIEAVKCMGDIMMKLQMQTADGKKSPVVLNFLKYTFRNKANWTVNTFVEAFTTTWLQAAKEIDTTKYAYYFIELLTKSMLLSQSLNAQKNFVLSESCLKILSSLADFITAEVAKRGKTGVIVGTDLNISLAYFCLSLFSLAEKHFTFKIISNHISRLSESNTDTNMEYKFEFFRIICSYEHFVPLNMPLAAYVNAPFDRISAIQKDCWKRHYLVGLLLHEVSKVLQSSASDVRLKALLVLKDILTKHDVDDRYQSADMRSRIATMYFPFVLLLTDVAFRLRQKDETFSSFEKKILLACYIYITKNIGRKFLVRWLKKESLTRIFKFVELLEMSINSFEYDEQAILMVEKTTKGTKKDAKAYIENINKTTVGTGMTLRELRGNLRMQTKSPEGTISARNHGGATMRKSTFNEMKMTALFSRELGLTIIEIFEVLVSDIGSAPNKEKELEKFFQLIGRLLGSNQCMEVLQSSFLSVISYVKKHSKFIFCKKNIVCTEMARLLLNRLCSSSEVIRMQAAGLTYLMMKKNYQEASSNITKIKIQLMIALSKLESGNELHVKRSLSTLKKFALTDQKLKSSDFTTKVEQLSDKLFTIVRNIVRMSLFADDYEQLCDMQYNIAQGYLHTPDLRLATFDMLSQLHLKNNRFTEAAFCMLHCAALITEYLYRLDVNYGGPKGSAAFRQCLPYISEEKVFHDESISMKSFEEEAICQSQSFSETGLCTYLEAASIFLRKGGNHESAYEVYRLFLPLLEKNYSYPKLVKAFGIIQKIFEDIIKANAIGKRVLGTYFRVAFFGPKLEDLNGREFIYKEKPYMQLSEMSEKIKNLMSKYGEDYKLIHESGKIDITKLDKKKVYAQITFVEPFLSEAEIKARSSKDLYSMAFNVDKFIFETPYTKSGKAHGETSEQWKKKTILTTSNPFPHLKTRMEVIKRDEIDLTPIENSIEAIQDRCLKLKSVIYANPPNAKNLQMVLQGSVRLQVNAGPLEIANTFLRKEVVSQYPLNFTSQLITAFEEFIKLCGEGLKLNQSLIGADQIEYQEDLELGFIEVKKKLKPYLSQSDTQSISVQSEKSVVIEEQLAKFMDSVTFKDIVENPAAKQEIEQMFTF